MKFRECILNCYEERAGEKGDIFIPVTRYTYDDMGRLIKTEKKLSNTLVDEGAMPTEFTTLSQNEYDALGQLKNKKLSPSYNNNEGLETLAYDYNIRGWLLGLNRAYTRDANNNNYFGFDLGYDKTNNNLINGQAYAAPQYNGNVTGMVWKSKGDDEKRKYDFSYDAVNRLTSADFNQYTSGSFNKTANVDYSVSNLTFDANGNIKTMDQKGLKLNASSTIDQLTYSYSSNSNQLSGVVDIANDNNSVLGDLKYDPAGKEASDYTYDLNGNLIIDNNKKIASITYNYLNLPSIIMVTSKGTITYIYDAAGNKLKKTVQEDNVSVPYNDVNYTSNITTITTYISGFVYESKAYSNTALASLQYNDKLQFIAQEKGRIRKKMRIILYMIIF